MKNMKLGILTCHDVFNYGSSLQAYALQSRLKDLGAETVILDYKPDYMYRLLDWMEVDAPKWQTTALRRWLYRLRMIPFRLKLIPKYLRYKRFNRKYLTLTPKTYSSAAQLEALQDYDAFVCGSDQIWNTTKSQCGEDPAFYLSFAGDARKIAYAASFGAGQISLQGQACVKTYLPAFRAVSVRERSGVELLGTLGISARQVLDPVFLLERSRWEALAADPGKLPAEYILVYGYDNGVDMEALALTLGCQVVSLASHSLFSRFGPEEFLYMIRHARLVVTSSFHAVAFSILFETPFVAMPTGNKALFERLESLLEMTGLQDRIWKPEMSLATMPEVDFAACRPILQAARARSEAFLKEALNGTEHI